LIKINRPEEVPKTLSKRGKEETLKLCAEYDRGEREFEINSKIYGSKTIKNKLKKAQHGKCCYCETRATPPPSYGDVEHFRPKSHYYWLTYDWDNLLFSCERCNRSFKRAKFPLENPDDQAKSHSDDITKERPLLINPANENPEDFISFNGMMAVAIDDNEKGRTTIKVLGLNESDVVNVRERVYNELRNKYLLIVDLQNKDIDLEQEISGLNEYLEIACKSTEPFAAMARAALRTSFQPGTR
jgi:uncharacterized protein (TIGR02646 family)